jgi:hypothetical protein
MPSGRTWAEGDEGHSSPKAVVERTVRSLSAGKQFDELVVTGCRTLDVAM